MDDYYTHHQFPLTLRAEPAVWVGKPGVWSWDEVNPGTAALIDVMEVRPADVVLDLGCGTGLVGLAAARLATQGRVTLADVNVAAVECARRTLAANGIAGVAETRLADGVPAAETGYDLILSHLPRGREVIEGLIRQAFDGLEPGGRFYFVAHKRAGLKQAIACARKVFGGAGVIRQKKGYHVALAVKPEDRGQGTLKGDELAADSGSQFASHPITLDGVQTRLVSRPGVFAWDRLDDGTAALVAAMEVEPGETTLDLGCGTGLLALAAARRGARAVAVDADLRAVECARRTLAANGVAGEVLISDCAQAVQERQFDVVLCNPPFHRGVGVEFDVARQMIRDAAQVLRPSGRLYLVSNAFLRYEREMGGLFQVIWPVYNDHRYRVLRALR